jgi:hypothetical protein
VCKGYDSWPDWIVKEMKSGMRNPHKKIDTLEGGWKVGIRAPQNQNAPAALQLCNRKGGFVRQVSTRKKMIYIQMIKTVIKEFNCGNMTKKW